MELKRVLILFPLVVMILLAFVSLGGVVTGDADVNVFGESVEDISNHGISICDEIQDQNYYSSQTVAEYTQKARKHLSNAKDNARLDFVETAYSELLEAEDYFSSMIDKWSYIHYSIPENMEKNIHNEVDRINDSKESYDLVSGWTGGFFTSVSGRMMFVGLIIGFVVLTLVAGLRVFGSGVAGTSVSIVVQFLIFLTLWFVVSAGSWGLITSIPSYGPFIWYILTFSYFLGVIFSVESY